MKFRSILFAGTLMLLAITSTLHAENLLFIALSDNTIVTYDTSSAVSGTIQASRSIFIQTNLNAPSGMAFDSLGNLYVTNSKGNTISKFNSSGVFQSSIGSSSHLEHPIGLAIDSKDNLFAVNSGWFPRLDDMEPPVPSNSISKFNSSGKFLTRISSMKLRSPAQITIDSADNIYVANRNGNKPIISKLDSAGIYQSSITLDARTPARLSTDSADNLYAITFGGDVIKYNSSGLLHPNEGRFTLTAKYFIGNARLERDVGPGSALLNPMAITIDSSDNLYIANRNGAICKFDGSGKYIIGWKIGSVEPSALSTFKQKSAKKLIPKTQSVK